jgi:hypothetical protein
MSDEEPDAAREVRQLLETTSALVAGIGNAAKAWLEQNRPMLEAIGRLAADPAVRAIAQAQRDNPSHPCYCLCAAAHKDEPGICTGAAPTALSRWSPAMGTVRVQVCEPCSAASLSTAGLDRR